MPLPHETLLVPHRTSEENLAASSAPGAASHAPRTRRSAGRTNPLADKMAAMGDKFRGRGRNASRGRSTNTNGNNDNNHGGRSNNGGRSRSRSVDSWGRSQSPSNRGRDATPRGQRKGRLFRNYAAYTSARRRSSTEEGRGNDDREGAHDAEGMQEAARARPNKWLVQAFQVNPKFTNLSRNKHHDEEAGASHVQSTRAKGGHPFVLPPGIRPAPRVDAWLAFAVASCAAVASIGQIHASSRGMGMAFSAGDTFALSTCAISFVVSLAVAGGLRYAPLRMALTSPRFAMGPALLSPLGLTLELLLLSLLLIFWTATMPIVVNGNAYYQDSNAGVPLAMAGEGIWNANLFYSSWASFLLCGYLCVEVVTLPDRRGTVRADGTASSKRAANAFPKRWTLLFLDAVVLLSASIVTYTSPACSGSFLKQTTYCTRAVWGMMTGGLLQILAALGVAALYRLASMGPHSRRRGATLSVAKRNSGCGAAAAVSLILQSVNAGMVTSPNGGGPGTSSGTLYFASWLGFALAFELCLRYLELKTTARAGARSRGLRSEVENTVYEDESEDEEVLMLRNGSEGGSGRSKNSTVVEGTVLEDASLEEDGIDAQSFVFDHAGAGPVREVRQLSPDEQRRHDAHEQAYLSQARNQPNVASASAMRRKLEPEELRQASSGSGGDDSGTDPLAGSIDVRSAQRSTSGESSNKDPDGEAEFHKSIRYETLPEGDLTQEHFFGAPRGAPAGFTSFHMESVEKLDEPHDAREPDGNNAMRHPSRVSEVTPRHPSNFSPIEEGSGEDTSPNTGSSPEKKSGSSGERQRGIGDNLKSVQAAQRPMRTADRSKRSGASGGSRSRERGLHALPAGGGTGTSRQTSSSRRTGSTTHSAVSKKSARSRRSGLSTVSSRQGADQSAVLTDDDVSGSNPPPTISEAGGSGSAPSTMSAPSTQSGSGQAPQQVMGTIRPGKAGGGGGPPPPPFLRSKHPSAHDAYDDKSQYSSSAPLRSIHTTPAEHGGSSDTIVSDPTLDAGLDDPSPQQVTKPQAARLSSSGRAGSSGRAASRSRSRGRQQDHQDSPSTTSYEKKYSDETDVQATSSDDNPSSQEAGSKGNRVVDNIVAAALAYAEKTHGEDGPHGISRSGTTSGGKTGGSSGPRPQAKAKASVRKSTGDHTAASGHHSSIHSFYTEDEGKGSGTPDKRSNSRSTGNPRYGAAAPVDDLVAKALSHANAQLTAGQAGGGQRSNSDGQKALKVGQQAWAAQQRKRASSDYSAGGGWADGAKSVGSMYSAGTDEFSEKDVGMHFDC